MSPIPQFTKTGKWILDNIIAEYSCSSDGLDITEEVVNDTISMV